MLVTGGAGFIGSNFIRYVLTKTGFTGTVVNVDMLTYAGNPESLSDIESSYGGKRYFFEKANVCDFDRMKTVFENYNIDTVIHFAAESHVDRSIYGPKNFLQTNIMGTFNLLEVAREKWRGKDGVNFHNVSTDEVFGSLGEIGYFCESTAYDPRSPYSASKAASDHITRAMHHTYGIPITISNCSNNYGPYQFPEKLVPLAILNLLEGKAVPVYGDGRNVRDWLFVDDHARAIWLILQKGVPGRTYAIGGDSECENLAIVNLLCEKVAAITGKAKNDLKHLITFVEDRPGHDRRYAVDCTRIKTELGWQRQTDFSSGLDLTIRWYMASAEWVKGVRSGAYRHQVQQHHGASS